MAHLPLVGGLTAGLCSLHHLKKPQDSPYNVEDDEETVRCEWLCKLWQEWCMAHETDVNRNGFMLPVTICYKMVESTMQEIPFHIQSQEISSICAWLWITNITVLATYIRLPKTKRELQDCMVSWSRRLPKEPSSPGCSHDMKTKLNLNRMLDIVQNTTFELKYVTLVMWTENLASHLRDSSP